MLSWNSSLQVWMRWLAALAVSGWLGLAHAGPSIDIDLRDEVQVTTSQYVLADIASVQSPDRELRERLDTLVIGKAPRPGYVTQVVREQVGARIERLVPGAHRNIAWGGADRVRVRSLAMSFPAAAYTAAAESFLRQWLAMRYEDFSLRLSGRPRDVLVPPGAVELSAELRPPARINRRMPVWVEMSVDGAHFRSVPVWFAVSAHQEVLVTTRSLEAGRELLPADVTVEYRDIATVGAAAVQDRNRISGMRSARRLSAGSIVTTRDLLPIPQVSKGQRVIVRASAGRVALTTSAIALTDGDANELIRVRTPDGRESYGVIVTGPGQVSTEGVTIR